MATKTQKVRMLDRIAKNSEERGSTHYEIAKVTDDLTQLKAMVSAYRTAISATLTGVRVQGMPALAKKAINARKKKRKK